jgi:hypothetical protein
MEKKKKCYSFSDFIFLIVCVCDQFGGKELKSHTTPSIYGMVEPTAVYVPLEEMLKEENFEACATEIFGPFQVI